MTIFKRIVCTSVLVLCDIVDTVDVVIVVVDSVVEDMVVGSLVYAMLHDAVDSVVTLYYLLSTLCLILFL